MMYERPETIIDLRQKIEDLFVRQKRNLSQTEIANILKRAGVDRVYQAVEEMVIEGTLIQLSKDPISPPTYRLKPSQTNSNP